MRQQTRQLTDALPCINLAFLSCIRRRLENAAPGAQIYANTSSGRLYITRQNDSYIFTTGGTVQSLILATTQTGYGVRFWYLCPHCNRRCGKLYIGREDVACRQCWGLHYASQSESLRDRQLRRMRKERYALWGADEPGINNLFIAPHLFPKPDGMHWRTFEERCWRMMERESRYFAALRYRLDLGRL